MQNLGNNLRFTISIQVTIVEVIVVVFRGIVVVSIIASSWMERARTFVVAGCIAAAVMAHVTGTKLYRVARAGLTEHGAMGAALGATIGSMRRDPVGPVVIL